MTTQDNINRFLALMENREANALRQFFDIEKTYWIVQYKARSPQCKMYLEYNDLYLYIQTDLAIPRIAKDCFLPLYFYLLNLNEYLSVVKFGLSEGTGVTLMAELPLDTLKYQIFESAIKTIANVFWLYRPEILLIATDNKLGGLIMPKMLSHDLAPIKILNTNQVKMEEYNDGRNKY